MTSPRIRRTTMAA
jgi:hypothetical protein